MEMTALSGLDDGSRAYQAIFGQSFLKSGRLVLDPLGESYFILYESRLDEK